MPPFGEWLNYHRKRLNETQSEFAKHVKLSVMSVRRYETGNRIPPTSAPVRIAKALGMNWSDFMLAITKKPTYWNIVPKTNRFLTYP